MPENENPTGGPQLTHEQTVARMKDIREEFERLAKRDSLDADDTKRWDDLKTEFETLSTHKGSLERAADLAKIRSAFTSGGNPAVRVDEGVQIVRAEDNAYDVDPVADVRSAEDLKRRNPWDVSNVRTFGRDSHAIGTELRARALHAVEKMPGATDAIRQAGSQILERFGDEDGKMARLVLALSSPAYMRAFAKAMRGQGLNDVEERAVSEARSANRAMSLTDAAGGFLVPFQLDPTVIVTSAGSYNEIRQIARKVVATGDVWHGVSSGAVSWSFDAEAGAVSDDTTTFAQPSIDIRTARGFVPISLEALQDEQNVTAEVARLLAEGKEDLESVKLISGASGSNEPVGIITSLTGSASVVASATADTLALADVRGTLNALPAKHRARASWLANNGFYTSVRGLDTSLSAWQNAEGDRPERLYGKAVHEAEAMDGVINATVDNLVAIAGNFDNYVIADRIGMAVEFIPQLFDQATGRPSGQRGWFAHYRIGADVVNKGAFRVLNVT